MLHCCQNLEKSRIQEILSSFSSKLINSGHSIASSQLVIVHGLTKYYEILRRSKLDPSHRDFQPVHFGKEYNKVERKLKKFLATKNWYSEESGSGPKWRKNLSFEWQGSKPSQYKIQNMKFTTIIMVPNSKDERLVKAVIKAEPKLARMTGYHAKVVEKNGRPLSKMLVTDLSDGKCGRLDCHVCLDSHKPGPTLCQTKSVVYECVCTLCDASHKEDPSSGHMGRYIGETSRTLYERSAEHFGALNRLDTSSFMFKHWSIHHKHEVSPPKFKFRVVKGACDPLTRMIFKAVSIAKSATMNSKSEWNSYKITRLTVEPEEWEKKKILDSEETSKKADLAALVKFKGEILKRDCAAAQLCSNNPNISCRKRRSPEMCFQEQNQKKMRSDDEPNPENQPLNDVTPENSAPTPENPQVVEELCLSEEKEENPENSFLMLI